MKNNVVRLILSLLVAFGIWTYVVTVVSPESESTFYNIPVVLENESVLSDKGLMLTTQTDPTVTLRLRGNRTDLNNLKVSDIVVVADLSKINGAGQQELTYSVSFAGNPNAFEIVAQSPGKVTLEVTEWTTKDVGVNVIYNGALGLEYIAYKDEVLLDYETVTLTGPKEVVDQITQAVIEVDLNEDTTETISQSYRYTLCDENGEPVDAATIKTNVAQINLILKIQRVKEVKLLLDVIYGGGASQSNTSIVMDQQVIKVSGSDALLDNLGDLVVGTVDLTNVLEDTVLVFPVNLPEGIENLSGVTEVEVDISFPGLSTKTLSITAIDVINVPADMEYDIGTKKVEVTLRGPTALMDALTAEDITIVVDLTDAVLGDNLYKPQVTVSSSEIGVLTVNGSVLVTLTEPTAEVEDDAAAS